MKKATILIHYRPVGLDCDLFGATCRIINRIGRRAYEIEFGGARVWFTRKELRLS